MNHIGAHDRTAAQTEPTTPTPIIYSTRPHTTPKSCSTTPRNDIATTIRPNTNDPADEGNNKILNQIKKIRAKDITLPGMFLGTGAIKTKKKPEGIRGLLAPTYKTLNPGNHRILAVLSGKVSTGGKGRLPKDTYRSVAPRTPVRLRSE
jgi:hypothetical protein